MGLPGGSDGKESAHNVGDLGSILGSQRYLEREVTPHSSILAVEFHGLGEQSMGRRVEHD